MSTDDTTSHPDFEVLSASFDGEAPEVAAHVAGCGECRLTLRWLRNAHDLVANPVPPVAASVRDQALARAGAAFEAGEREVAAPAPSPPRTRPPAPIVRPAPAPVPISVARDHRERRKSGSGVWVGLGSVAAVVVALVVGVGVLGGNGSRDDTTTFASGSPSERTTDQAAGDSAGGVGSNIEAAGTAGGVDGGDLGDLADPATLAARARPALTQRQATLAAPAPQSAPSALGSSDADLTPKVVGTRPCEMEVRAARPGLGTVVYYAIGRVDGAPVVVLGFEGLTTPPTVTLLALVQAEGCRVALEAAGP